MKTYFEAFTADGGGVLGNLNGQGVFRGINYRRSKHYRALLLGNGRPRWPKIAYWLVVTEGGRELERIPNIFAKESSS